VAEVSWADLAGQAEDALTPIPSGEYDAVVTKAEIKFASTGKKMFSISAKITSGPHINRIFWNNFTVSPDNPNAMLVFFRQMGVFGLPIEFFKSLPADGSGDGAIPQALMGKPFRARLSIRSWQGTDSNQLDAVLPPNAGVVAAPQPAVGPQPVVAQPQAQPVTPQAVPVPGVPQDAAPPQPVQPAAAAPTVEELQAQLAALQAQAAASQPAPATPEPAPVATTDWAAQAQQVPAQAEPQPTASQDLNSTNPARPF
jgi:hypothetical protein